MELYKYVFPARIDVLQRRQIRFTRPSEFNDPWEGLPNLDALFQPKSVCDFKEELFREGRQGKYDELLEKVFLKLKDERGIILNSKKRELIESEFKIKFIPEAEEKISQMADSILGLKTQDLRSQFNKVTFERLDKLVGILCLSEIPDSLLMWSHYADSHKGFVIGFDSTHGFFDQRMAEDDVIRKVKPVRYTNERPSFTGFSRNPDETEIFSFADHMLLTKADVWENEREWRMVNILEAASEHIGDFPSIYLFILPPGCITSIIFGCRIDGQTETSIRDILATKDFSHVCILRAEQDRTRYKLNIVESDRKS